jgi:amino acid adenylation domain-containing protein
MSDKPFQGSKELSSEDRELLAYLLAEEGIESADEEPIRPRQSAEDPPQSFAQQRLWFLDQWNPGSAFYNVAGALRLSGELNVDALDRSLNEVVRRHEALRTTFTSDGERPVQVISPSLVLPLPLTQIEAGSQAEQDEEVRRHALEEARLPFDLERGPLMRVKLLRLTRREHVLLVTMHHIICDGWSVGVLVQELAALYDAFSKGRPSPLPDLPIQYADFAIWQREWLKGEERQAQLAYWEKKLSGVPATLELPSDRPRPLSVSSDGARQPLNLSKSLTEEMKALSLKEGVTLFITLMSAFKVLLCRYSNQTDIPVGTPIANRNRQELELLIGFFANTLVMRTELSKGMTFAELLSKVKEVALEAYANQDIPFEQLLERLNPDRDVSRSPLFQVMIALENTPHHPFELSGLTLSEMEIDNGTAKFDLTLWMEERPEGLSGYFEYNTDLFDSSTLSRMAENFQTLLRGATQDPRQAISDLPLLSDKERGQLLLEWNDTQKDYGAFRPVHEWFERQVERTPDAIAVTFQADKMTYRELNRRANQLAHLLHGLGVGPDVSVGICVERSLLMPVGVLGVMKSGGTYVPIDPAYPKDRQTFMLEDTRTPVLLTQSKLAESLPETDARVISMDADWDVIARQSDANPKSGVEAENLLYVVYTSGSTGRPKGVAWSHAALANMIHWILEDSPLRLGSRVVNFASLSFDVSSQEFFPTLCTGATLVFMPEEIRKDAERLFEFIAEQKVERLFIPFVALQQFIEVSELHEDIKLSLKEIITAGEQLQATQSLRAFFEKLPDCNFHNFYGPSEGNIVTVYQLEGPPQQWPSLPSIGVPISNTQVYVLDESLNPTPVGVPGELHIAGTVLARCYLNRPDMTAEKFIPNPFGQDGGDRMYRTGDLARYLADGKLEFLGRIDSQVKIRGYRVELGEIETVLAQHPAVKEAVVLAREIGGQKKLVGYVVGQSGGATTKELRSYLQERLPDYMVPATFVTMESFPLSPNRKVDRQALPTPDRSKEEKKNVYEPPRNTIEEYLAGMWAGLLDQERVGIHDNFFELGGHSLLATQVVSRIKQKFSLQVSLRTLFEKPTVAGLAGAIEAAVGGAEAVDAPMIGHVSASSGLPLSFAQQRLWFFDELQPNSPFYNIPGAVRFKGDLDVSVLRRAFKEIVRRHESLRTTFTSIDGRPAQKINPGVDWDFPTIDLSSLGERERADKAASLLAEEAERPFVLSEGPLFRGSLLKLSEGEHILLLNMHHIISDGWSIGIVINEAAALYDAFLRGQPSPLPELPIQYADFAVWQRERLQGETLEKLITYWMERLEGDIPVLQLPTDHPRPAVQTFNGDTHSFALPRPLSDSLNDLSQREGATLFMTLLAAFNTLLYRYSGQEHIIVGTPIANRNREEIEGLVGFFVNTLVIRTELSSDLTFRELMAQVKAETLGAYDHQDMPFERLVEELKQERDPSYPPVCQVMFVLQNTPASRLELPGVMLESVDVDTGTSKFDLTVWMTEKEEGFDVFFEYNTDLFDLSTVRRMSRHFQSILESVAADSEQTISSVPLLAGDEMRQLLTEWNGARKDYGEYMPVHKQFEAQVQRTPDAIAIISGSEKLTYLDLNRRANQLARRLRRLGVGPDVCAAIFAGRSVEAATAMLAALKAGGAYAHIDPSYSREERDLILEAAKMPVVLTVRRLLEDVSANNSWVVCLDTDWQEIASEESTDLGTASGGENIHSVAYTFDSAGRPRGVATSDASLANLLAWHLQTSGLHGGVRTMQFARPGAGMTFHEFFPAWCSGGTVIVAPEDVRVNGPELLRFIETESIERIFVPLATLHQLSKAASARGDLPASLKEVVTGGESARVTPQIEKLFSDSDGRKLCLIYGELEAQAATFAGLEGSPSDWPEHPAAARPVENHQVYLLDGGLAPVPVGVVGELHISGAGLARGYLNLPVATAERFIPNPFGELPGTRMYKTGKLGRRLADGRIEILERADQQAEIRGYRIALGEVEAALNEHSSVEDAAVIVVEPRPGLRRLVAYVAGKDQEQDLAGELRNFLKQRLPVHMTPTVFMMMEALPLDRGGELDRGALPAPEITELESREEFVPPRTAAEKALAEIWCELLGVEQVGAHDDFFEMGGHSLLATRLVSQIKKRLSVQLQLRKIFEDSSLRGLASAVEMEGMRQTTSPGDSIGKRKQVKRQKQTKSFEKLSDEDMDSLLDEMLA